MKKIIIFFVTVIAIMGTIWYTYEVSKIDNNKKIALNNNYEKLLNKEITGTELASIINKTAENNINNKVEKDSNGTYINNGTNSINIEIKFKDNDSNIKFEKIYQSGQRFVELYNNAKFSLKKINYHQKTKQISYLYFEEV